VSRYETFVLRLWIEDGSAVRHGEVRHVATGKELRFLRIDQAIKFIEFMARRQILSAESPDDSNLSPDHVPIDFGPWQSRE